MSTRTAALLREGRGGGGRKGALTSTGACAAAAPGAPACGTGGGWWARAVACVAGRARRGGRSRARVRRGRAAPEARARERRRGARGRDRRRRREKGAARPRGRGGARARPHHSAGAARVRRGGDWDSIRATAARGRAPTVAGRPVAGERVQSRHGPLVLAVGVRSQALGRRGAHTAAQARKQGQHDGGLPAARRGRARPPPRGRPCS